MPCFLSFLAAFSAVQLAHAEFSCSSEVSYKWVKQTSDADGATGGSVATASPTGTPGTGGAEKKGSGDSADKPQPVPSNMRFATVERAAKDEASAKNALAVEVARQKARASERCKRDHENFGECLATKLSVKSSLLNSLGFSTRAQVETAITEECKAQQGTCLTVESADPVCREVAAGTPAPADAAPAADKKAAAPAKTEEKAKAPKKK